MSLNQLKQKILRGPKRIKQGHLLWICLDFVNKHPEHFINIGVQWIDDSNFIFNCKIFSNFVGRKTNTLNNYFKHHGFQCRRINNNLQIYINNLFSRLNYPLSDGWIIRYLDGFTQSTTENESKKLKFIPSENIKRQRLRITKKLGNNNNENPLEQTDNKNDYSNLYEQDESKSEKSKCAFDLSKIVGTGNDDFNENDDDDDENDDTCNYY